MRKISVILVLIGLALVSTERYCYALFDSGDKEPRLQNDSYEKLVNKNLELRKEVDTLIKEQEQLREIYKLLLEKVKALQRGNALALKDKEDSVSAAEKANQIIGKTKKELADADSKIAELSALMNKASTEVKSGTDTYYEMNIMRLKDSVKSYEKKYGEAIAEKSGLDKTLAAKNTELAAKNTELAAKSAELADIRGNIAGQEGLSKKLTDDINTRDAEANIRAKKIDELSGQLKASLEKQAAFDRELTEARGLSKKRETEARSEYEKALAAKNAEIKGEYDKALAAKNVELAAKSAELADIRGNIAGQEGLSKKLTDDINARDAKANVQAKKIDELSGQLKASLEKQAAFDRELTEARGLSKKRETEARSEYEKALAAKNVELKASLEKQKALSAKELKEAQSSSQAALKTREAEIKTEHEKTLAAKNAEFKTTLEKEAAKLKPREARLTALEADINKTEASLKDAREELKSREEDARKFKDIFNTEALKKKYPDIFGGKDAVKELRTSAAALKVRNAVNKAGLQRKILSEEAALARADIEKALIDKNNLKNNIASADKKISQLKGSIEEVKADMKSESDQAAAEEDRIKGLEDSLNKVAAQQKEVEARLLEAPKRTARIEDELKKAIIDIPKDSAPGFKTEGIKSLESELERSRNEEDSLKEKLRTAEKKVEDLKGTIISSRAKAKKELAARAAAGKQNIKSLEKDTAKIESQKKEFKKEYQRMMNKISVLQGKGRALSAGIKSKDAEIAGLKNIVAKEALKIKHAEEASAGPGRKAPGPADEAETALSAMMGKIDELKAMNARIEKDAASTKEAEQDAKRRAESEKQSADEAIRKTNKERLDMHYNLAVVFDKAGMYKEAEKEYARCLDINPNDAGVHYNLGILYDDKLNNNHKAGYHYKQYLSLKPKEVGAIQVRQWLINIELENRLGKETR